MENSKNFARLVVVQAVFISFIPESLKRYCPSPFLSNTSNAFSFLAPLINIFDYKRYVACAKYSIPIIKQRLSTPSPDEKVKVGFPPLLLSSTLFPAYPFLLLPSQF